MIAAGLVCGGVRAKSFDAIARSASELEEAARILANKYVRESGFAGTHHAEERLIDGENYYRLGDYQRAAIVFMDIVQSYPNHPSYPDALYYLGESLFALRDYYGARTWFEKFMQQAGKPGFGGLATKVVSRLVEIAIRLEDYEGIERYFAAIGRQLDAQGQYVRGKYLYFRGDLDAAVSAFDQVRGDRLLELKAAYFKGAIFTKQGRIDDAIAVFRQAAKVSGPLSKQEQEMVDLCNLGLGRLLYEKDLVENAAAVYQKIGRYSPFYDVALYEAAAVQMRAGNMLLAERILEVLTMAFPDSPYLPQARLLRGNLLLRAGRYNDAQAVFQQTIAEFSPVQESLDKIVSKTDSSTTFFDVLTQRAMGSLDTASLLPKDVMRWVERDPDVRRAVTVTEDLAVAKESARESARLWELINAVIDGVSPVNAVPELRTALRGDFRIRNELVQVAVTWMQQVESSLGDDARVTELRKQRAELAKAVEALPVSEEAFRRREQKAKQVYTRMKKELARQEVLLDQVLAMAVALERYVSRPGYAEDVSAEALEGFLGELQRHKDGVAAARRELNVLRIDIDKARYQVGVGDERDREDRALEQKVRALLDQYAQAVADALPPSAQRALGAIRSAFAASERVGATIEERAERAVAKTRQILAEEKDRLARYQGQLTSLHDEAEDVVSGVAKENFSGIRERFHQLLLRADVGIIDIAWLRKEEHKRRAVELSKARSSEMETLDATFRQAVAGSGSETGAAP